MRGRPAHLKVMQPMAAQFCPCLRTYGPTCFFHAPHLQRHQCQTPNGSGRSTQYLHLVRSEHAAVLLLAGTGRSCLEEKLADDVEPQPRSKQKNFQEQRLG
jgi:hypothetical protein